MWVEVENLVSNGLHKVTQDFILFFHGEGVMATSPPLHPFATSIRFLPADISWYDIVYSLYRFLQYTTNDPLNICS